MWFVTMKKSIQFTKGWSLPRNLQSMYINRVGLGFSKTFRIVRKTD